MIVFAPDALEDLESILEFNLERDRATALEHLDRIRTAILILEEHPQIGRLISPRSQLRELVISHGHSGYVALYEHSPAEGLIRVAAVRHQREAGYDSGMNQILVEAIEKKQRLRFTYNGKLRIVEPQCYGIGTKGTELLRVHQIQGGSQREPLFDVAKIKGLVALDEFFTWPGPNYKRNDSAMTKIFCQL